MFLIQEGQALRFLGWLAQRTCYTFAIALISVLGGQVASFYGYLYFYAYYNIHEDSQLLKLLPDTIWDALIAMLILVSVIHYVCFGVLRILGLRWEAKSLRIINDHVQGLTVEPNLSQDTLSRLLESLSKLPLWNSMTAGVLGLALFSGLLATVMGYSGSPEHLVIGLVAGFAALLTYLYITFTITDFLTSPIRSQVKRAINERGGKFNESNLFSLKAKFASFIAFLFLTLFAMNSLTLNPQHGSTAPPVLMLFTVVSVIICTFLVVLYFMSIFRSIEEVRKASEELASGGQGYLFSGSLDQEFVALNRSMNAAAEEVNHYRTKMETLVRQKTIDLEKSWQTIHESDKRFRSMVENGSDIISVLDADGVRTYISPSCERVLGYTPEELLGKSPFDLVHPDDIAPIMEAFAQGIHVPEKTLSMQYRFRHKDGSWRYMDTVGKNLLHDPSIAGVVTNSRDITERQKAEEDLRNYQSHLEDLVGERTAALQEANAQLQLKIAERRQIEDKVRRLNEELEQRVKERTAELENALQELKELDTLKDSFLSLVSHELRTPLTSIRSFSEILLNYDVEKSTQGEFLRIINSECERLTRLINDVLDLAKIEAGGMVWHDTLISLEAIIKDATRTQHQLLQDKSLWLTLNLPPELPRILADRDRIHQVITNLLGNSIKFSSPGTRIYISAEPFKGKRAGDALEWIRVSIRDQGMGIDERDVKIIFDKFRQGSSDSLNERPKGTGLGLPICKEIITHYGGNIWVESLKGGGSTFFFTLPTAINDDRPHQDDARSIDSSVQHTSPSSEIH